MPLSLDSIYRPFSGFFTQKFAPDNNAPVMFRFVHLPRGFDDSDFLSSSHPEWGPSPAIAEELLSIAVDGVIRLDGDGRAIWWSTSRISELYHDEILSPAIAYVSDDVSDNVEREARFDSFNNTKATALEVWEKVKASSVIEGTGVEFRPSTALPGNWWDRTDSGVWT